MHTGLLNKDFWNQVSPLADAFVRHRQASGRTLVEYLISLLCKIVWQGWGHDLVKAVPKAARMKWITFLSQLWCVFEVIVLLEHSIVFKFQPSGWWFEVMLKIFEVILLYYSIHQQMSLISSLYLTVHTVFLALSASFLLKHTSPEGFFFLGHVVSCKL